jgi:AcrR family transcriptional regulator
MGKKERLMSGKERKERERQQREKEILDAAESLFIEKGYESMTMDEVAKRADFTKRTVYAYFTGKEDLHAAIVARSLKHLNDLFEKAVKAPENGLEKIKATGLAFIRFAQSESKEFAVLCRNEGGYGNADGIPHLLDLGRESQRQMQIMGGAIAQGIADGSIRPGLDPTLTAIYLSSFSTAMMSAVRDPGNGFLSPFGITPDRFITEGMAFFESALRNTTNTNTVKNKEV